MPASWERTTPGLLRLPSGRTVRGRGLRHPLPEGQRTEFGLYLRGLDLRGLDLQGLDLRKRRPQANTWPSQWLLWPDFGLPLDRKACVRALVDAWIRAESERVEIACWGGVGRTGTALACLTVLDGLAVLEGRVVVDEMSGSEGLSSFDRMSGSEGLSGPEAIALVRGQYCQKAVETLWQRRFVNNFPRPQLRDMEDRGASCQYARQMSAACLI